MFKHLFWSVCLKSILWLHLIFPLYRSCTLSFIWYYRVKSPFTFLNLRFPSRDVQFQQSQVNYKYLTVKLLSFSIFLSLLPKGILSGGFTVYKKTTKCHDRNSLIAIQLLIFWPLSIILFHLKKSEGRISSIDWAQLSGFHLRMETEAGFRNSARFKLKQDNG
jgi:hypothetical protein